MSKHFSLISLINYYHYHHHHYHNSYYYYYYSKATRMNALSRLSSSSATTTSLNLVPAKSLYVSTPIDWLESTFHFNFSGYWDENKQNFGVLRVLNDDLITPRGGLPAHPHREMEIISYVVQGGLSHKDSMGSQETLGRGSVQYMSAGTGVRHSEFNASDSETLRFL